MSNQADFTSGEINQQHLDVGSMPSFSVDRMADPGAEVRRLAEFFAADDRRDAVLLVVDDQSIGVCLLNSGNRFIDTIGAGQMFIALGSSDSFTLVGEINSALVAFVKYRCAVSKDDPYVTTTYYDPNDIPKCPFHPDIPMERVE